jgi:ankyrin repeat protein
VHTTAILLAFGADPELPDPDGRTPLGMAMSYGHDLAMKLLQSHITQRATDRG